MVAIIDVVLGAAGGALLFWLWAEFRWGRPLRQLRRSLAFLAEGSTHVVSGPLAEGENSVQLQQIAERLRGMNTELSEELLNLQAVLNCLSEGVLIIDLDEKIRLANPSLQRMLGLTASPIHRPLMEVLRHHAVREVTRSTLTAGESRTLEVSLTVRQPDGQYQAKYFQLTTAPLLPHGLALQIGAIGILHDITQLKSLENVRREFVANISHELRTPLSIINGYLETLLEPDEEQGPETARRFHEVMWKHGQRLRLILDDLLTLARLESPEGAGAMHFASMPLRPCVEAVVDRLASVAAERQATVRLEIPTELPLIEADADRLDQVFFNLIDNALKHAVPPRLGQCRPGPEIVVKAETDRLNDGVVHISFADNGQGVPMADQSHLFERFYRVHKDRFRQSGGSGLGLSIVKHIVKAHGGQVSVESYPGSGATFHVWLPCDQTRPVSTGDHKVSPIPRAG